MKIYQAQTPQYLSLTKILQNLGETSTPQENEHTPATVPNYNVQTKVCTAQVNAEAIIEDRELHLLVNS